LRHFIPEFEETSRIQKRAVCYSFIHSFISGYKDYRNIERTHTQRQPTNSNPTKVGEVGMGLEAKICFPLLEILFGTKN